MRAVIQTGGKQYLVQKGDKLRIERIDAENGKSITINDVLFTTDGKAASTKVGIPFISGASVTAKIVGNGKTDKIRVFKMKRRTRYRRNKSHRQQYTEIEITDVKI